MKLPRRQFLHLAAGAAALPAMSRIARAQAYPSRPVRIIVGTAAGGAPDIFARLMGQLLSERLGQQFVIENRTGAGGNIATEAVVRAPADGYTVLLVGAPNVINAAISDKLSFNFVRDMVPVASIVSLPLVMQINPAVPAKTVPEFISYAKTNPGKISLASAGNGTTTHVAGELFKMMTGAHMVHVPYRGGAPAQTDLIGGQVQVGFFGVPDSIQHFRAGKLRALAVTSATRSHLLPDVPTVGEFVRDYEASTWYGFGVPRNTPVDIIDTLNKGTNSVLADPAVKTRIADMGATLLTGSPADFQSFVTAEFEKWSKVIRAANIKPE
jgi:tripartite-type tricarboxylate transporter receptor subunit TctC